MKLKGLHLADVVEIQEAVTDELKKVQKEEFSAAFQKLYDRAKACIYDNGAYFELKEKVCMGHKRSYVYTVCEKWCPSVNRYTRSVRKVSSHFEYLENRLRGLDVTWQPVRGDLTVHLWTVNLPWG